MRLVRRVEAGELELSAKESMITSFESCFLTIPEVWGRSLHGLIKETSEPPDIIEKMGTYT